MSGDQMALIDDIFRMITSGSFAGLPTVVMMIIPFVIGLVVGFLIKKVLKIVVIAAIVIFVAAYLGFFGLSLTALRNLIDQYGPIAIQYGVLLIGMLPLTLGFIIGLVIGFLFS
jgi:uncharacterized membrane protein (Fun14 family)